MKSKVLKLVLSAGLIAALGAPAAVEAATVTRYPWYIPDNIRIVQSAPVDNVRTFASVQAAINSIPTSDPNAWFYVKIMPGTYSGDVALSRANIVFEGDGGTTIEGNVTCVGVGCGNADFIGLNMRDISSSGSFKLEHVSAGSVYCGPYGNANIKDSTIGSFSSRESSSIVRTTVNGQLSLWYYGCDQSMSNLEDVTVVPVPGPADYAVQIGSTCGSTINATPLNGVRLRLPSYVPMPTTGLKVVNGASVHLRDSVFQGSSYGIQLDGVPATVTVNSSQITGGIAAINGAELANHSVKVGSSLLSTPPTTGGAVKVVNCHDTDYNPIPNQ